jgi:ubiquinone/menaquinone biosynthesis C-methylase UbiE
MDPIREHYRREAIEQGLSKQSTMKDIFIRDAEIRAIHTFLSRTCSRIDKLDLLEVGCGNGYTAEQIVKNLGLSFTAMDFSREMLDLACSRQLEGVRFEQADIRELPYPDGSFNVVFTERCLINLESWERQTQALEELARVLRPGGFCLLIEGFIDGLENLNAARSALGLDPIPQPSHNLFFRRAVFTDYIERNFAVVSTPEEENFLSTYYFGSKVLYPALLSGAQVEYNNKFIEFFSMLPPFGEYSYVRQFVLQRR